MPAGLIAGLSQLFHKNAVALGVHRHQAQAARQRFVLRDRDGFAGQVLGLAGGVVVALGAQRFFTPAVHLLLSPRGSRDKTVQARQGEEKTNQAKATRPDFDADEMAGHHDPVEESESGTFVKERGDMGTSIEGVMP